jgi:uncharacterized protein YodC (DUF2158 family)
MVEQFLAGETVTLKSGGETMTIKRVEANEAYCKWFHDGQVKSHSFNLVQLERFTVI